jgi:hypothetical protein
MQWMLPFTGHINIGEAVLPVKKIFQHFPKFSLTYMLSFLILTTQKRSCAEGELAPAVTGT